MLVSCSLLILSGSSRRKRSRTQPDSRRQIHSGFGVSWSSTFASLRVGSSRLSLEIFPVASGGFLREYGTSRLCFLGAPEHLPTGEDMTRCDRKFIVSEGGQRSKATTDSEGDKFLPYMRTEALDDVSSCRRSVKSRNDPYAILALCYDTMSSNC